MATEFRESPSCYQGNQKCSKHKKSTRCHNSFPHFRPSFPFLFTFKHMEPGGSGLQKLCLPHSTAWWATRWWRAPEKKAWRLVQREDKRVKKRTRWGVGEAYPSLPSMAAAPPGIIFVMKIPGSSGMWGLSIPPAMLKPRPEFPCTQVVIALSIRHNKHQTHTDT